MRSYYDSIENMPLYNWEKCQNGDLTFCRVNNDETSEALDGKAWEILNYEYMEIFGVSRHHRKYLELQKRKTMLELELIETGNRFLNNKIRQVSDEIQNVFRADKDKQMTYDSSLIYLSKFMGFNQDKRTITVLRYFTMIQEYGKKN
jgi:hypothetical protein